MSQIIYDGSGGVTIPGAVAQGSSSQLTIDASGNLATSGTVGSGAATVASLVCTAGATFGGGYGSTGATISTAGAIQANGALTVDGASTLTGATTIAGALAANGGITCDTNKFTVADTSGNVATAGTLSATGDFKVNTDKLVVTASSGNVASAGSFLSTCATAASGYATGAGGAVTQGTSRTTGVTCSKPCGAITTHTESLAAGAEATFTVTNTLVAAGDVVVVSLKTPSATGLSFPFVSTTAAGSFNITLTNLHATTADTSASVINFAVIKAVAA